MTWKSRPKSVSSRVKFPQCWDHLMVFKSTPSCTISHSGLQRRMPSSACVVFTVLHWVAGQRNTRAFRVDETNGCQNFRVSCCHAQTLPAKFVSSFVLRFSRNGKALPAKLASGITNRKATELYSCTTYQLNKSAHSIEAARRPYFSAVQCSVAAV